MKDLTLREILEKYGVSRRAVQGYEKAGIVRPTGKNERGHLLYDEETVEKIRETKKLQEFKMGLKEILKYYSSDKEEKISQLQTQKNKLTDTFEIIGECLKEITKMIQQLTKND